MIKNVFKAKNVARREINLQELRSDLLAAFLWSLGLPSTGMLV